MLKTSWKKRMFMSLHIIFWNHTPLFTQYYVCLDESVFHKFMSTHTTLASYLWPFTIWKRERERPWVCFQLSNIVSRRYDIKRWLYTMFKATRYQYRWKCTGFITERGKLKRHYLIFQSPFMQFRSPFYSLSQFNIKIYVILERTLGGIFREHDLFMTSEI